MQDTVHCKYFIVNVIIHVTLMTNSLGLGSVEIPYGKGVFWCCNDIIIMASLLTSSEVAEEKLEVYIVKTFSARNQTYLNQGTM